MVPSRAFFQLLPLRYQLAMRVGRNGVLEPCGTGCHLKRLLSWWRIRDDGTCGCDEFAAKMDAWGPDGCEQHMDEILGHLRDAAAKRGLPWLDAVGRLAVTKAIAAARRESHAAEKARQADG